MLLGTADGTEDWIGVESKKKSIVAKAKSNGRTILLTLVNAAPSAVTPYCCSPLHVGWNDGAPPNPSKASSGDGLYLAQSGAGFSIRVAALAAPQKLTLYIGCWAATCSLNVQLQLSPGSAAVPAQSRKVVANKEVLMYRFEVVFRGGAQTTSAAGASLSVTWTKELDVEQGTEDRAGGKEDGNGNVTFEAATLKLL